MFYLTGAAGVNIAGNAHIQLTAPNNTPSSGTYPGIVIFQDQRDVANAMIGGDNTSFFDGALYFPEAKLTFSGGAGGGFNVAIVDADQVVLGTGSNTVVNLQGSAGLPPGVNLITNATIVE
jgi:hypothetical protein